MKLSTRSRYGLRMLIFLGVHFGEGPIQLREIAEHEGISVKYLEQIVRLLKPTGVIKVARGAKGGYMLAYSPSLVNIYNVLSALEGNLKPIACVGSENFCDKRGMCPTHDLWVGLFDAVQVYLNGFRLDQLVAGCKGRPIQ